MSSPPVTVVVCTNQGCVESHHGTHQSAGWGIGSAIRNVLGSAVITAAIVGTAVGLYRRRRFKKRATLARRLRFLVLHRFTSERDAIISALLQLGETPFDAPTLARAHSAFASLLEDSERGLITYSCFRFLCPSLGIDPDDAAAVEAAFRLLDGGNDSVIDFLELLSWLSTACSAPDADLLARAFATVDVEGRGEMGATEVGAVVRALAPQKTEAGKAKAVAEGICEWLDLSQPGSVVTSARWREFAESPVADITWTFAYLETLCRRFGIDFADTRDRVSSPHSRAQSAVEPSGTSV